MAYRGGRDRFYDERDRESRHSDGPLRRSRDEVDIYERRERRSSPPRGRAYEEETVRVRERSVDRESRVPNFLREDNIRRGEAGALVLRQREVETVERPRPRPRSPSPVVYRERERFVQRRSPSPELVDRERVEIHDRVIERERSRARSPPPRRGQSVERVRTRIVERERSPSPEREVREHVRIVDHYRAPSPSPSPSPPPPEPPVIRGPRIEREVITHYRDIDHGTLVVRPPSPPPPPRPRGKERDTEIDIYTSRNKTEVDIHESSRERPARRRGRSHSRPRPSPARPHHHHHHHAHDDEVIVRADRNRLEVDINERHGHRRAHSAAPKSVEYDDEAEYITSRINERGRMGEAWHGHTKDWAIVDVPPGTERVRMDGVGGGAAEVTWQKYNGVRRAKFIPERDSSTALTSTSTTVSDRDIRERDHSHGREHERELTVQIYNKDKGGREREREVEVEKVTDRRISLRPGPPSQSKRNDMWTEITKDLVVRDAIEELGYEYEETEWFFYVMQYLRYEDVLELVSTSDRIRRVRKEHIREIQWEREREREYRDDWEQRRRYHHHHNHHHHHGGGGGGGRRYEDERIVEHEVIYDRQPARGYHR